MGCPLSICNGVGQRRLLGLCTRDTPSFINESWIIVEARGMSTGEPVGVPVLTHSRPHPPPTTRHDTTMMARHRHCRSVTYTTHEDGGGTSVKTGEARPR